MHYRSSTYTYATTPLGLMIVILHYYNENWHEGDDRQRRQSGYKYIIFILMALHRNGIYTIAVNRSILSLYIL